MPSVLGSTILAHSRAKLYEVLRRVDPIYTDTDSVLMTEKDYMNLTNETTEIFGKEFG